MDEFTAPNQETGLSWITFGRIQKYVKLGFRVFRDFEKKNLLCVRVKYTRTRITLSKVLHYARVLCLLFPSWNWLLDGRRPVVPIEVFVLHGL